MQSKTEWCDISTRDRTGQNLNLPPYRRGSGLSQATQARQQRHQGPHTCKAQEMKDIMLGFQGLRLSPTQPCTHACRISTQRAGGPVKPTRMSSAATLVHMNKGYNHATHSQQAAQLHSFAASQAQHVQNTHALLMCTPPTRSQLMPSSHLRPVATMPSSTTFTTSCHLHPCPWHGNQCAFVAATGHNCVPRILHTAVRIPTADQHQVLCSVPTLVPARCNNFCQPGPHAAVEVVECGWCEMCQPLQHSCFEL